MRCTIARLHASACCNLLVAQGFFGNPSLTLNSKLNSSSLELDRFDEAAQLKMPSVGQAGYYCSVCECILRDSQSYLDHINGKYHNRALGMSMRVERSTANDVSSVEQPAFMLTTALMPLPTIIQAASYRPDLHTFLKAANLHQPSHGI